MGSPDTKPQSEEFARENQFRVEVPEPEILYRALDQHYSTIGDSYFEPGDLFSQITTMARLRVSSVAPGVRVATQLKYQDQDSQYWPAEQIERLKELLEVEYGYASEYFTTSIDSLDIKDDSARLRYFLNPIRIDIYEHDPSIDPCLLRNLYASSEFGDIKGMKAITSKPITTKWARFIEDAVPTFPKLT